MAATLQAYRRRHEHDRPGATVLVRQDGPAARITLNRPEKRNALSLELMQELIARAAARRAPSPACARS